MSTDFQNPRASAREAVNDNKQYPKLPDFEEVEQHIYGLYRGYIKRGMLEPIHELMRAYVDADRAMRAARDAEDAAHIKNLCELVRMPNAEYVADAHNAAVKYLRLRARANQEHKLSERTAKEGGAT